MYPYRKSKAWYHGPREKWMKLVEKEKTHSEEMQDKLEPIYDYVNKILKGSG